MVIPTQLVIVDGVPGDLNQVNANEVDNISVLKDAASSAIYGIPGSGRRHTDNYKKEVRSPDYPFPIPANWGWEVPTTQPIAVGGKALS